MKLLFCVVVSCFCADMAAATLEQKQKPKRHQAGVQMPLWIRSKASVTGFQASDYGADDGRGNVAREYVNGYNRVDIVGNAITPTPPARYAFPRTSNYKFLSMAQVKNDPNPSDSELVDPNGGTLTLHSVSVSGGAFAKDRFANPRPGVEVFYRYDLIQKPRWTLGLELGVSHQSSDWKFSSPVNADVDVIRDTYPLGGVVLREANVGQEGAFDDVNGRKPIVGSIPQRSSVRFPGVIVGGHELSIDMINGRIGPTLSFKLGAKWNVDVIGGLAITGARSKYRYANRAVSQVVVDNIALPVDLQSGTVVSKEIHLGLHSAVRLGYQFTEDWAISIEGRHLWMDSFGINSILGSAQFDISDSYSLVIGVSYSF